MNSMITVSIKTEFPSEYEMREKYFALSLILEFYRFFHTAAFLSIEIKVFSLSSLFPLNKNREI